MALWHGDSFSRGVVVIIRLVDPLGEGQKPLVATIDAACADRTNVPDGLGPLAAAFDPAVLFNGVVDSVARPDASTLNDHPDSDAMVPPADIREPLL
jgi:hypothetical protein